MKEYKVEISKKPFDPFAIREITTDGELENKILEKKVFESAERTMNETGYNHVSIKVKIW